MYRILAWLLGKSIYQQMLIVIQNKYPDDKLSRQVIPVLPNWLGKLFLKIAKFFSGIPSNSSITVTLGKVILSEPIHAYYISKIACHEFTHARQMQKYGLIHWFLIYIVDYIDNLIKYKNRNKAYFNIPFEIEARLHEND
jgi:hypothetical protein